MSYNWTLQTSGPNLNWYSIASSSDGTRVIGCDPINNLVYTGLYSSSIWSWTQSTGLPNNGWYTVASSSDGTKLVVAGSNNYVYTGVLNVVSSTVIWTQNITGLSLGNIWNSVASSSDGTKLVLASNNYVYTGELNGTTVTWTQNTTGLPTGNQWNSVASSSDGTKLVVAGNNISDINGFLYTGVLNGSTVTWTQNITGLPNDPFSFIQSVASSSDGTKLVIVGTGNSNFLYTGVLNGTTVTWTPQIDLPNVPWKSVASNSLGDRIVVGGVNTYVYTGVLTGTTVTWIQQTNIGNDRWYSVASDSTGNNIFAGIEGNYLYTGVLEAPCFLKGSKILTANGYEKIEDLKKGDLIETYRNGLKEINLIGKREIYHQANKERIKDILYKYSKNEYIEYLDGLTEDLVITGGHSILVDDFKNDRERKKNKDLFQEKYPIIDGKHRLLACVDENASIYEKEGKYFIYHLALESEDEDQAYGIYANGMLVESCEIKYLKEVSGMELL